MSRPFMENLKNRYLDWVLFKRVLVYLKPYSQWVALAIFLLLGVSLLNLAGPYFTKIVIDDYIKASDYNGLDVIASLYLAVLIASFIFQFFQNYLMQFIGQKVMFDLRSKVFAHLHKMSFSYFDKNPIGKMITRVVNDVEVLNEMLTSGLILIFSDLFTLVGIFVVMFYLDWRLTLVVCLVFPLLAFATRFYRVRARDALRKNRAYVSELNSYLEENLSGINTVQSFNLEKTHHDKFEGINRDKLKEDLRTVYYNAWYMPSIDFFNSLAVGMVIWYGGGRFVQDEIQLGILVAFIQYLQKFFEPVRDLAEKFNIIQTAMASSERIFELLDTPEQIPDLVPPLSDYKVQGEIEFKNVWFAYKDENYILKDISFSLAQGESLAIVGATGSGKSTLVNVLCRFYDIQKGDIKFDGKSIRDINKYDLRRQIALVQQDVFLFSGNILDNIRLGNQQMGQDEIESISQAVSSHNFISSLPFKYEQELQEGGVGLSSGQRQLLSFARALAIYPQILVLDEATSSVDPETENEIQKGIRELTRGRTSIIIAHRLATLLHADKILVLKHGKILEFGKRKELLQQKGVFYKLCQSHLQAQKLDLNNTEE
ncbi:MAG: ABC transporter ATP-binding protein [Nitrospina sp.]|jgi:ATP-binding cassette, subfamily B, multidrug efflux pump|nr:ABC transporter ATP-binding protein [Nitrospina sp.]MBT3875961.1 ABC transporter ATP-binding protein [Nitrospina sp.]MBT4048996.1 ABC transporter ATP-binding protein [Nitrospina sp.]MBT4557674.1 ABC transporter ATP-binding protein [Nitrospina sp.]MBT5347891.1 ABC transporter ATP-binding protein [Nitrospina sp.]